MLVGGLAAEVESLRDGLREACWALAYLVQYERPDGLVSLCPFSHGAIVNFAVANCQLFGDTLTTVRVALAVQNSHIFFVVTLLRRLSDLDRECGSRKPRSALSVIVVPRCYAGTLWQQSRLASHAKGLARCIAIAVTPTHDMLSSQ